MDKEYKYTEKAITQALMLLNKLEVKGVENASILVNVYNVINNPMPEEQK